MVDMEVVASLQDRGAQRLDCWTPRELRTSFVSLLSHRGVGIEEIARLARNPTRSSGSI